MCEDANIFGLGHIKYPKTALNATWSIFLVKKGPEMFDDLMR